MTDKKMTAEEVDKHNEAVYAKIEKHKKSIDDLKKELMKPVSEQASLVECNRQALLKPKEEAKAKPKAKEA